LVAVGCERVIRGRVKFASGCESSKSSIVKVVVEPVKPRRGDRGGSRIVPVERVVLLVELLKVVSRFEGLKQSRVAAARLGRVGRAVCGKFSEVEIASEDRVNLISVSRESFNFSSPSFLVGAVEIAVDDVKLSARGAAGESCLNGRALVNGQRGA
jgi:hypothetical protein